MIMTASVTTPFRDLATWAAFLSRVEIPVLADTAAALAGLAEEEDGADAQGIAAVVMRDPMMSARLFRHLAMLRRGSQLTDVESVTGCILMLGVSPFFRAFRALASIAMPGADDLAAQTGLPAVLRRAQRAADYAFDWAVRRNDLDAEIIATAALLHDFAEMLLWCVAPALSAEVQDLLAHNPAMRSVDAQKSVFNIGANELQSELLRRWRLPDLLVRITDDLGGADAKVRNVKLAVALARHSARGWDNPALPDDYAALGALLNLPPQQAKLLVAEQEMLA